MTAIACRQSQRSRHEALRSEPPCTGSAHWSSRVSPREPPRSAHSRERSTQRTGWAIPRAPSAATPSLTVLATENASRTNGHAPRGTSMLPSPLPAGQSISLWTRSLAPHASSSGRMPQTLTHGLETTGSTPRAMPTRCSINRPRRRHEAPNLGSAVQPSRTNRLRLESLPRPLQLEVLAPHRLGFESGSRFGSARGPSPTVSSPYARVPAKRRLPWRPPPGGHHHSDTEVPERLDRRRGSSSEEPLPDAGARSELRDNAVCPWRPPRSDHHHRDTFQHPGGRTDVGFELRGARTSAASPWDERTIAPHERNQRSSHPPVSPPAEIPSPSYEREVTFEEAPGSVSKCTAMIVARESISDP
jgi:hypothetical protein